MAEEEVDDSIESGEGREELLDDDEISPEEQGFMEGAEGDGQGAKCRTCGKVIARDDFFERSIDGEIYRFCSEECSENYEHRKKRKK
ncbi:hypothetical protein HYU13_03500 [Candidatus Woesearchaeota archaeon]|nr:hypothetical protein [Candidatus Woesearchaeota archaeon]